MGLSKYNAGKQGPNEKERSKVLTVLGLKVRGFWVLFYLVISHPRINPSILFCTSISGLQTDSHSPFTFTPKSNLE